MPYDDSELMKIAVSEARKSTAEDERIHPFVGAVVMKDGEILTTAHRGEFPKSHAEFIALELKLKDTPLHGATIYTTLEPCTQRNHPKIPCASRIAERRISRVVIGMLDPNPSIQGQGYYALRDANIDVELFPPELVRELEELNRNFIRHYRASPQVPGHILVDTGQVKDETFEQTDPIETQIGVYHRIEGNVGASLSIERLSERLIKFSIDTCHMTGGRVGAVSHEALLKDNVATFRTRDSLIRMTFEHDAVRVESKDVSYWSTGGVSLDGVYVRGALQRLTPAVQPSPGVVESGSEFLKQICSGANIRLAEGLYNLSQEVGRGSSNVAWIKEFDGYGPYIENVDDLTIDGRDAASILVESRYSFVLSFRACRNVVIRNLVLGHTPAGQCVGGVLSFQDCEDIRLEGVTLYGCGSVGLELDTCRRISVRSSVVKECTSQITNIKSSSSVVFSQCTFRDTHGSNLIELRQSSDVTFMECIIRNNQTTEYGACLFKIAPDCQPVILVRSSLRENAVRELASSSHLIQLVDSRRDDNESAAGLLAVEKMDLTWISQTFSESVDGPPGYEVAIKYPLFSSKAAHSADEINSFVKSTILDEVYTMRRRLLDSPKDFDDPYGRLPILEANFVVENFDHNVVSLAFNFTHHHPAAAHPSHWTRTVNLTTAPFIPLALRDVFPQLEAKGNVFQEKLNAKLSSDGIDQEAAKKYTSASRIDWKFTISKSGVRFIFDEYEIASCAAGKIECELSPDELQEFMPESGVLTEIYKLPSRVNVSPANSEAEKLWPPGK